jgi:hypothetical protein
MSGDGARLALEPHERVGRLEQTVRQDLHGDLAAKPAVARAVHLAHAARSDRRDDVVRPKASARRNCHR